MKQYITQFNKSDTLGVVSLYPKKGEVYSAGKSGIASFAKNIVNNLTCKAVVFTNKEERPNVYKENNALVDRCFKKNTVEMWINIFNELKKFNNIKTLLVQFDFALYGDIAVSILIIPFLFILRVLGYKTHIVVHSVVADVNRLKGHLGLTDTPLDAVKIVILNSVFRLFYILIGLLTTKVIVNESALVPLLTPYIASNKIEAISHGVDTTLQMHTKAEARKALGILENEQIVLFFGFVNWFKGADIAAKAFKNVSTLNGKPTRLIMAGGKSATLHKKEYYRSYFKKVLNTVHSSNKTTLTGYVSEEMVNLYFSACDLVVFPYRYFHSASGVLAQTLAYKKPFIVSKALSGLFDEPEWKKTLAQFDLDPADIIFDNTTESITNRAEIVLANGIKQKLAKITEYMGKKRAYPFAAKHYQDILFAENKKPALSLDLNLLGNRVF